MSQELCGHKKGDALALCRQWLEEDEGRSLEDVVRIDEMSRTRSGRPGFNEKFVAMCKAVIAAQTVVPSAVARSEDTAWLIERGQQEGQVPTLWLQSDTEWTEVANEARRFASKDAAEQKADHLFASYKGDPRRRCSVTEHVFLNRAVPSARAALTDKELGEAYMAGVLLSGKNADESEGHYAGLRAVLVAADRTTEGQS